VGISLWLLVGGDAVCAKRMLRRQLSREKPANLVLQASTARRRQDLIRRATENDIPRINEIRNNVRENKLTDPARVTMEHVRWFISNPRHFVWEQDGQIVGLSAPDPKRKHPGALHKSGLRRTRDCPRLV
jgi:hypothetical protein